ncbi:MAG: hypothetical protein JSV96_01245 [Candidatus Aminicenantes bacterium]|nr:MAG: hypothetical protein JSV96_01245 [Candidatus Aminicenantes bacterium]
MEEMLNTITLQKIVTVLLILSTFLLLKSVFKKERKNMRLSFLVFICFGFVLFYIQQNEARNLSLNEIKELILPSPPPDYAYHVDEGYEGGIPYTRYTFEDPKPKLSLSADRENRYLRISRITTINIVMDYLSLPKVNKAVPELASITGSLQDTSRYRWDDYPLGVLLITRTLCSDIEKISTYHCISSITIKEK